MLSRGIPSRCSRAYLSTCGTCRNEQGSFPARWLDSIWDLQGGPCTMKLHQFYRHDEVRRNQLQKPGFRKRQKRARGTPAPPSWTWDRGRSIRWAKCRRPGASVRPAYAAGGVVLPNGTWAGRAPSKLAAKPVPRRS